MGGKTHKRIRKTAGGDQYLLPYLFMKYKRIKKLVPFCESCQKEIQGNGSIATPYYCDCGLWEFNYIKNDYLLNEKKIYNKN